MDTTTLALGALVGLAIGLGLGYIVKSQLASQSIKAATEKADSGKPGHVAAPFQGVVTIVVEEGAQVSSGDTVATIEAMKMEASITAPVDGTVERIALSGPQAVEGGDLVLVLDRYFVHRVRMVTGNDGNPLNEVEMYVDALLNNDGVLEASTVIKLKPSESVLKIEFGDRIELTVADFERLSSAFFAEIEAGFEALDLPAIGPALARAA